MPRSLRPRHRGIPGSRGGLLQRDDVGIDAADQLARERQPIGGQNAKTLVKYDGLRIVLIALKARSRIPEHHTDGQISIQAVVGHIQVRAQGRTFELRSGGLLALDQGVPHDVEAVEESAFLLIIARPC